MPPKGIVDGMVRVAELEMLWELLSVLAPIFEEGKAGKAVAFVGSTEEKELSSAVAVEPKRESAERGIFAAVWGRVGPPCGLPALLPACFSSPACTVQQQSTLSCDTAVKA